MSKQLFQPRRNAIIVIDVQKDFCPDGNLPVPFGDKVIVPINNLTGHLIVKREFIPGNKQRLWDTIFTRDQHPAQTPHFEKWPVHCVKGTLGATIHKDFNFPAGTTFLDKGMGDSDAYSAFDSKALIKNMSLESYLTKRNVTNLYIGGLATDYCVKETVLDALKKRFAVYLLTDAIRAVNIKDEDEENALAEMKAAGAVFTTTKEIISKL